MTEYDINLHFFKISENLFGQRIDNFLRIYLRMVPKSMIYRIIRTGKVRVNKKKVHCYYKLQIEDVLMIPSIKRIKIRQISICSTKYIALLQQSIIYEDNHLLILNKPTGFAVHDGSGLKCNVIDGLRNILNSKIQFLELVHRLDRGTSGILLLAKNRVALLYLQQQWRSQTIQKEYLALVCGLWDMNVTSISFPVFKKKFFYCKNVTNIKSVDVNNKKNSKTYFQVKEFFNKNATLLKINPITGRTHQIRAHTQYAKHPIIGDYTYGDYQINMQFKQLGLNRLFLHAFKLSFIHPKTNKQLCISASIDQSFCDCLLFLRKCKSYVMDTEK